MSLLHSWQNRSNYQSREMKLKLECTWNITWHVLRDLIVREFTIFTRFKRLLLCHYWILFYISEIISQCTRTYIIMHLFQARIGRSCDHVNWFHVSLAQILGEFGVVRTFWRLFSTDVGWIWCRMVGRYVRKLDIGSKSEALIQENRKDSNEIIPDILSRVLVGLQIMS